MPVFMIKRLQMPCILVRWFNSMGIVISKDTFSILVMQCQRVSKAMWYRMRSLYQSGFNPNPISTILLQIFVIEIQQNIESRVAAHDRAMSSV